MRKRDICTLLLALTLCACAEEGASTTDTGGDSSPADSSDVFVDEELVDAGIDDKYRNYYEIFVSSYADSDGDGIGDLPGITSKLSYLADLGFTGLYLTPIFKSTSYHKYDVDDYFTIDEDFGTMDDLRTLVSTAHDLGIDVILDLPLNHTSLNNSWYQESLLAHRKRFNGQELTDDEEEYADLYTFYDSLEEAQNSGSTYYQAGANDFYYEANFSSDMPELNFDCELAYELSESVFDFYLDLGVDGFRLDAAKYYYYNNNTKNIEVLNRFKEMCGEDSYLVAEVWDSESVIEQYSTSDIDSFFYFPMSTAYSYSFITTSFGFQGQQRYRYLSGQQTMIESSTSIPAPFLDNHDMARMTQSGNEKRTKMQLGLLAMLTGSTFTYYGDEIGMSSANTSGSSVIDTNYRTHYYWGDSSIECSDPSGAQTQTQYFPSAYEQLEDPDSILNYQKRANQIRNAYKSIPRGEIIVSEEDEVINSDSDRFLLTYEKTYEDETIRLVFNFSSTETYEYETDMDVRQVLLSDLETSARFTDGVLSLPPYSIAVLI